MKLLCDICKKEYSPSEEQEEFIYKSKEKGMTFIMLKCPLCFGSYPLNPISLNTPLPNKKYISDGLRCPKKTCSGVISYIDDKPPF